MPTNSIEKRRRRKETLYKEQAGQCHWCGRQMLEEWGHEDGHKVPDDLATREHLDHKLSGQRRKYGGEFRIVLACLRCNHDRGVRDAAKFRSAPPAAFTFRQGWE